MAPTLASSRLKPVPLGNASSAGTRFPGRTGFSREAFHTSHRKIGGAHTGPFPAEAGPTGKCVVCWNAFFW